MLATDFSQSHCNFKSQVKSSAHRTIPCLPFILNRLRPTSPDLDPIPISSRLLHVRTTIVYSYHSSFGTRLSYNYSARTPKKTPSSIVKYACLLARYLVMDVLLLLARVLWDCVYRHDI
jgi:hypothetical protein